jgi:hypothetical protein
MAVVGAMQLSAEERTNVAYRLKEVYGAVTECVEGLLETRAPASGINVTSFYRGAGAVAGDQREPDSFPVIRLISGLADGTDQIAFQSALEFKAEAISMCRHPGSMTHYELVAVLPCEPVSFRDRSPVQDKSSFNTLLARCSSVIQLDGICDAKMDDSPNHRLIQKRRARCFLAQSRILLRQCDVLIAVVNPDKEGGIGGTRQTISSAIEMGIPVICVSTRSEPNYLRVLRRRADLDDDSDPGQNQSSRDIREMLIRILADPESVGQEFDGPGAPLTSEEQELVEGFFAGEAPTRDYRHWLWARFENLFRPRVNQSVPVIADSAIDYFKNYRLRASMMSAHYAGKYRGAFLANYGLSAAAVSLAGAALLWIILNLQVRIPELVWIAVLILLGGLKLIALVAVFLNTNQGNDERWNDKAIDYRYLTERLRAFYYIPRIGSLFTSPPTSAQYAGGILRQKVVSWMLYAIVRQAPVGVGLELIDAPEIVRELTGSVPKFYRLNLRAAAERIKLNWMGVQIEYHDRVATTQTGIHRWIERCMSASNRIVISIVIIDLAILIAMLVVNVVHWKSPAIRSVHEWTPLLIFGAVVLPAIVASLNGLSFQSECERLATRSAATSAILRAKQREWIGFIDMLAMSAEDPSNPGAWVLSAVDLAESCTQVVTDEVAEWSVLYSRDLTDI